MEKLYNRLTSAGVSNLVMGIVVIAVGVGAGIVMIVNGGKMLASKKDITF